MRTFLLIFTTMFVFGIFVAPVAAKASVVINEIMYDTPAFDDGREWIEIVNTGTETVDLTGWKLFENNVNHGLAVSQGNILLEPGSFTVIADNPQKFLLDWPGFSGTLIDSAFSLSNTGEALSIKDAQGAVVDIYIYASSFGGGGDGNSLQLITTGWVAEAPTPGEENETLVLPEEEIPPSDEPVGPPSDDGEGDQQPQDQPLEDPVPDDEEDVIEESPPPPPEPPTDAHIVINEIMYDAPGSDAGHEWIELFNTGSANADLSGWKLVEDETDHTITLVQGSGILDAADFAVIAENAELFILEYPDFTGMLFDSSFSLSNTGEMVAIKDTHHVIRNETIYDATMGADGDGRTLQYFDVGFVAAAPTPGTMNVYDPESLDDENNNTMPSGGGTTPESDTAPLIEEELTPSNVIQAPIIDVEETDSIIDPAAEVLSFAIVPRDRYSFLQIENPGDDAINISEYLVTLGEKSFVIPDHTIIAPHSTIVIAHAKARFASANRAVRSGNEIIIE